MLKAVNPRKKEKNKSYRVATTDPDPAVADATEDIRFASRGFKPTAKLMSPLTR